MKNISLLFLVIIAGLLSVSCVSVKSFSFKPYTQTVKTNHNQDENYIKANEYLVEAFNSSKSIIQFSDKEGGIVKGKYMMQGSAAYGVSNSSIVTIKVKDSLAKITIVSGKLNYQRTNKEDDVLARAFYKQQINRLATGFTTYMKADNEEDW